MRVFLYNPRMSADVMSMIVLVALVLQLAMHIHLSAFDRTVNLHRCNMDTLLCQSSQPAEDVRERYGVKPHMEFMFALWLDALLGNTVLISFDVTLSSTLPVWD